MKITRKSIIDGVERTMDIDVTEEQLEAWTSGTLIQKAMPNLTASEREFIMTGITDEQWEKAYPADDIS